MINTNVIDFFLVHLETIIPVAVMINIVKAANSFIELEMSGWHSVYMQLKKGYN